MIEILCVSLALLAAPLALGIWLGLALRRLPRGRVGGWTETVVGIVVLLAVVLLYRRFPVVGVWDAGLEFILLWTGMLLSAHRAVTNWRDVLLASCSTLICLLLLELACRLFLPGAPVFATAGGMHLFLEDALHADPEMQPADTRSKEIVCSVVYGGDYPGLLSLSPDPSLILPETYRPRPGATRRVLHLGDSMVFGFGVAREERFTSVLERLEPGVEHINGGIAGIAPDAYLAVLRRWLAMHRVDEVVMYAFEGNDVRDVDGPYPCCAWQSLLVYGSGGASLRCARATEPDLRHATWTWLRYNSPPPYLVRALIGRSAAAAYLGAAIVQVGRDASLIANQTNETRLSHIQTIFRAAREELRPHNVPFVIVVLPERQRIEHLSREGGLANELVKAARRADVVVLDASQVVQEGVAHGLRLFIGPPQQLDVHFNADGHVLLANWLHDQLNIPVAVRPQPDPSLSPVGVRP